jgi:hypothetical protein
LQSGLFKKVVLHVKPYATFVSDATAADVFDLLEHLSGADSLYSRAFAEKIRGTIDEGDIQIITHDFWNSPLFFYEMPADLKATVAASDLLVFKGDANYRRLLGDRTLPFDASFRRLVDYLPVKGVAIRTLKSEIIAGLDLVKAKALTELDAEWLHNGKFGLIQIF